MNTNTTQMNENSKQIFVEKDILTTKQMRQILNAYSVYKPIENKICLDIPILPRDADNKMSIAQFDELCRFYAYYHIFAVQEAKMKASATDKASQKKIDAAINDLRVQTFKEFASKKDCSYQLYPLYKKINPFKGYEEIFKNIFNTEFKNEKANIDVEKLVSVAECKTAYEYPNDKYVKAFGDIIIKSASVENKELEMFHARRFSKILYLYRHIMKLQNEVFYQAEIEKLAPNDSKGKKELLKKIMKQFQSIIGSYVDGVVVQSKNAKTEEEKKTDDNTNKFLALTWHAFSSLQDMKFEEQSDALLTLNIRDNMFKNFPKKLNKLQKIYYGNSIFTTAFNKLCAKFDTINAYLSSKITNSETKKIEYINTFENNNKVLTWDVKVQYKEIEKPIVEKVPKQPKQPKQVKPKEAKPEKTTTTSATKRNSNKK